MTDENRKILKLLGDIAEIELFPKKTILRTITETDFIYNGYRMVPIKRKINRVDIVLTDRKPVKKYGTAKIIQRTLKEFGFDISLDDVANYCMATPIQKKMKNKHIHLDLLR